MRASLTGTASLAFATTGYAAAIEPNEITIERVDVHLPRLPEAFDGFKIAQLSDLHYGPFTGAGEIGDAVDRTNALSPDLVVLTGDFVTSPDGKRHGPKSAPPTSVGLCAQVLSRLHAPGGSLAVLGNHDVLVGADYVSEVLRSHKIPVLRNSHIALERGSARLWVTGLDDALESVARLDLALAGIPRNEAVVLLVHEPDFADTSCRHPVDLQISGHSHGGQVRLPLLGAPYLPRLARKYPWGFYRVGPLQLYTNRGIGTIEVPLRFGAPPEVTLFTLHTSRA